MSEKTKVAVLVSGGGTNLQALIDKVADGQLDDVEIVRVISSREDAFALTRAEKAGITTAVAREQQEVLKELKASGAEIVVLAGYMRAVSYTHLGGISKRRIHLSGSWEWSRQRRRW